MLNEPVFLEENLSGFNTNIIFNKKTHLIKLHNKLTNDYQKKSQKAYIISGVFYPFAFNIGLLGYGIVTIFGAILIIKGNSAGIGLTIGTLISFTQFAKVFLFLLQVLWLMQMMFLELSLGQKEYLIF
ncbi:ABC transporter transmembrane domain-containing protein [Mycoplasmopsis cynos]|uniref:ABC transporter transmembrane domain-containing protein n=1 Tax=Mycoplasmopsis cynos TaxID=171284 RepID=UPI002201F176|nr:ABC transporter transmembrane domain-containing protein [Mycoplasmopsis cynos]UWV80259.1 ABC transporter transmembrane domain-containing protein [Mycoplasmopsis cynos]